MAITLRIDCDGDGCCSDIEIYDFCEMREIDDKLSDSGWIEGQEEGFQY